MLDAAFYRVGVWGIPLATSLVNLVGAAALAYALRGRLGRLGLGAILDSLARVVVASGVAAGVAYPVWWALDDGLGRSFAAQAVAVAVALVAAGAAYLAACRSLRVPELNALLLLVRHRAPAR